MIDGLLQGLGDHGLQKSTGCKRNFVINPQPSTLNPCKSPSIMTAKQAALYKQAPKHTTPPPLAHLIEVELPARGGGEHGVEKLEQHPPLRRRDSGWCVLGVD